MMTRSIKSKRKPEENEIVNELPIQIAKKSLKIKIDLDIELSEPNLPETNLLVAIQTTKESIKIKEELSINPREPNLPKKNLQLDVNAGAGSTDKPKKRINKKDTAKDVTIQTTEEPIKIKEELSVNPPQPNLPEKNLQLVVNAGAESTDKPKKRKTKKDTAIDVTIQTTKESLKIKEELNMKHPELDLPEISLPSTKLPLSSNAIAESTEKSNKRKTKTANSVSSNENTGIVIKPKFKTKAGQAEYVSSKLELLKCNLNQNPTQTTEANVNIKTILDELSTHNNKSSMFLDNKW